MHIFLLWKSVIPDLETLTLCMTLYVQLCAFVKALPERSPGGLPCPEQTWYTVIYF